MFENTGWVSVGVDYDTSAFAVNTLRLWWDTIGQPRYPDTDRLLICAGARPQRLTCAVWKVELTAFAADTGPASDRLPPANLFSQIAMNWRGRPLSTHQVIVDLISATTTATGLTECCVLDTAEYPTGIDHTSREVDSNPGPP